MRPLSTRRALATSAMTGVALGASLLAAPLGSASAVDESAEEFRPQLVEVSTPDRDSRERVVASGLDVTEHYGHDDVQVVIHSVQDLAVLRELEDKGLESTPVIEDLLERRAEVSAANLSYALTTNRSALPSGRTWYRTLDEYNADMTTLAKRRPGIAKRFELPLKSIEQRPIYGIEIGSDVRRAPSGRPTFLLMGVHHAREWPSGELAMEFATDLVNKYGKNARITRLLDKSRVIVVPVVNVDGFDLSRTDGEYVDLREANSVDPLEGTTSVLATPGQAYKRKNCRPAPGQTLPAPGSCRASATSPGGYGIGVDLNRNYGGFWGGPGASDNPADPTYWGEGPISEPETQNIQQLVSERQVTMLISNHTFSNLVLRPNGVNPNTTGPDGKPVGNAPDEGALKKLGARMSAQNGYQNIHGWQLYDTTGTTEDWSYNATGGFGYTFEIGPNEFHPPYEEVVDEYVGAGKYQGKGNREAYLIALEHAVDTRYSGVLKGKAPRGAVIRLQKTFQTPTWEDSFEDHLDSFVKIGAKKRLSWIVNPSTRPVVRPRTYEELSQEPSNSKQFTGTTIAPNGHRDHEWTLNAPADVMQVALDWPTPDDLDLEVYRKKPGGGLEQVGSSGNLPGEKESTSIYDQPAGTYVFRVINYSSVAPEYTLDIDLHDTVTRRTSGKREAYTLTCEKKGKVLQRSTVFINRGQEKRVDLGRCRRRW